MPAHDPEDKPQHACYGTPEPYDVLIEEKAGSNWRVARRVAMDLCRACPVQRECFSAFRDEQWVRALTLIKRPPTQLETCGRPRGAESHYKRGEEACDACLVSQKVFNRERRQTRNAVKRAEADPAWARQMHAAFDRLKNRGAEIPDEVRAGERAYQTLRARKQRKAAVA